MNRYLEVRGTRRSKALTVFVVTVLVVFFTNLHYVYGVKESHKVCASMSIEISKDIGGKIVKESGNTSQTLEKKESTESDVKESITVQEKIVKETDKETCQIKKEQSKQKSKYEMLERIL